MLSISSRPQCAKPEWCLKELVPKNAALKNANIQFEATTY